MEINKKFYNEKDPAYPVIVNTVGELKKVLSELPDELPINQGYSNDGGAQVIVYNMAKNFSPAHLALGNAEEY